VDRVNHLYTLGHSNLDLPQFLLVLKGFDIAVLADVRSRPQSGRFPWFSQPEFEQSLREAGVRYLFLGEELGGRPDDPKVYREDGLVNYRQRRKSYGFRVGLERVLVEREGHVVALMCAEEDPITCHRFLMICPELVAVGVQPIHIRRGGVEESQLENENRLLEECDLAASLENSLFPVDRVATLEDAYVKQTERCAFRVDPAPSRVVSLAAR
jgi:uncharacterized protein (DUF488 family)